MGSQADYSATRFNPSAPFGAVFFWLDAYLLTQGCTIVKTSHDPVVQFGGVSASTLTDTGSAIQVNFNGVAR